MRAILATVIVLFSNLITCTLSPYRRAYTKAMALDRMSATVPVDTSKGQILFHTVSRSTYRRASHFFTDEPDTLEWIDSMTETACFWDIGANVGAFGLYAALKKGIRVLCFEPSASTYSILSKNIELNRFADRAVAYCLAFDGETKLDTLNMGNTKAGESMHGFGTDVDQFGREILATFRQGTVGFSIDDFVSLFSPPLPTHVKIDVDGLEADILRGGRETLSARSVQSVIIEVQGDREADRKEAHGTFLQTCARSIPDARNGAGPCLPAHVT